MRVNEVISINIAGARERMVRSATISRTTATSSGFSVSPMPIFTDGSGNGAAEDARGEKVQTRMRSSTKIFDIYMMGVNFLGMAPSV